MPNLLNRKLYKKDEVLFIKNGFSININWFNSILFYFFIGDWLTTNNWSFDLSFSFSFFRFFVLLQKFNQAFGFLEADEQPITFDELSNILELAHNLPLSLFPPTIIGLLFVVECPMFEVIFFVGLLILLLVLLQLFADFFIISSGVLDQLWELLYRW